MDVYGKFIRKYPWLTHRCSRETIESLMKDYKFTLTESDNKQVTETCISNKNDALWKSDVRRFYPGFLTKNKLPPMNLFYLINTKIDEELSKTNPIKPMRDNEGCTDRVEDDIGAAHIIQDNFKAHFQDTGTNLSLTGGAITTTICRSSIFTN
ncbi:hypothetical protein GWI33_006054 [Rhynchophorus ferrugineus]|uniref:Uncharacterized protein n=1 Tax=Rhynchophorus ferrugineus TaxID=354439 RepID=A0A834ITY1_RHYFE|nr:hypothetical protein GWI33_006054 [Rhynchophorus ferrugineus]